MMTSRAGGPRISRDSKPWVEAPPIPAKDWIAAQKLVVKGWQNLGYKVTMASGAKPTRDPGIRARIRGRGVDWGDPALFCRLSPMPFLMIGYTMNGCQNLNSRRASRGDYEKVVNQYPPFCALAHANFSSVNLSFSSKLFPLFFF